MSFLSITLEELPSKTIPFDVVRRAFETCVPYDCPSRARFRTCYPGRAWGPVEINDITMEETAKILCYCLPSSADIGRFALFFTGERIASHEVISKYLTQAFIKV
jgi:hypothetical protein